MTLVAYLLSLTNADTSRQMQRGWKRRQSVEGVDRNRWNGKKNQLSDSEGIFRIISQSTYHRKLGVEARFSESRT